MKRILFVVHSLGIGGVESLLANISNALVEKGYGVDIAVTNNNLDSAGLFDKRVSVYSRDEPRFSLFKKIPYIRNFYESGMWSRRKSPKRLYSYFVRTGKRYDAEIAFFFGRPLKCVYGSPNPDSKKILWIHSDYRYAGNGWYMGFKTAEEAREAYCSFDNIVCVSAGVKESFTETTGVDKNLSVIYNLQNEKKINEKANGKTDTEKTKTTFVSVGRLAEEKGFKNLLIAAKKLNDSRLEFELLIIGDGNERPELERFILDNGLNNVKLLGKKENPYPYIKNADIYVSSSLHEAYGLSVAEAMILGKPVISTDCAGPRELLDNGKYGLLVENSAEGLYNGMLRVLTEPGLNDSLIEKAKQRKAFFDSDKILNQIEELFSCS